MLLIGPGWREPAEQGRTPEDAWEKKNGREGNRNADHDRWRGTVQCLSDEPLNPYREPGFSKSCTLVATPDRPMLTCAVAASTPAMADAYRAVGNACHEHAGNAVLA